MNKIGTRRLIKTFFGVAVASWSCSNWASHLTATRFQLQVLGKSALFKAVKCHIIFFKRSKQHSLLSIIVFETPKTFIHFQCADTEMLTNLAQNDMSRKRTLTFSLISLRPLTIRGICKKSIHIKRICSDHAQNRKPEPVCLSDTDSMDSQNVNFLLALCALKLCTGCW